MHELGDLEIARVAQAAWTALSYILPNHEPIKPWANLNDAERSVMLTKVRSMIDNGPGSGRVVGIAQMNLEDARKHMIVAAIVEILKLSDEQIEKVVSWEAEYSTNAHALGNDNASNLVPIESKLTPGHEGATESEQDLGPIAAATGGGVSGVQQGKSETQLEPGTTQGESRAEFEHDRFGTAGPTTSDEPTKEAEAVKP
jgi:hypothetical protein